MCYSGIKSKFQPYFSPADYTVTEILDGGTAVRVTRDDDGKEFIRHPDDIKTNRAPPPSKQTPPTQDKLLQIWKESVMSGKRAVTDDSPAADITDIAPDPPVSPAGGARAVVNQRPNTPQGYGRGRGRGRPPGQKPIPRLDLPPSPQQFPDEAMPE